jgi:hypothetical protein
MKKNNLSIDILKLPILSKEEIHEEFIYELEEFKKVFNYLL